MPSDIRFTPVYNCGVCGTSYLETSGILSCEEYFYCNGCTVEVFHRALKNLDEFPASCCTRSRSGLPPSLFEDLLGADFIAKYRTRLHEFYTPEPIRVYCANAQCVSYKHPKDYDNSDQRWTIVSCNCGMTTCVGCKSEWIPDHVCLRSNSSAKPEWVPKYSATCRIKQCPKCAKWIKLSMACNHMSCVSCHHKFCFVRLLPWSGPHTAAGCPVYNDPITGYDADGFELTPRGPNVYTGRDRKGFDRLGTKIFGEEDQQDGPHTVQVAPVVAIDLDDGIWDAIPVGGFYDELPDLVPAVDIGEQVEQVGDEEELAMQWPVDHVTFDRPYMPIPRPDLTLGALIFHGLELLHHAFGFDIEFLNISSENSESHGVQEIFDMAEEDLSRVQPFYASDFGLQLMFGEETMAYDRKSSTILLEGISASGVCLCTFEVSRTVFGMLEDVVDV